MELFGGGGVVGVRESKRGVGVVGGGVVWPRAGCKIAVFAVASALAVRALPGAVQSPFVFCTVNRFCAALLCGRAGRLTAKKRRFPARAGRRHRRPRRRRAVAARRGGRSPGRGRHYAPSFIYTRSTIHASIPALNGLNVREPRPPARTPRHRRSWRRTARGAAPPWRCTAMHRPPRPEVRPDPGASSCG